jgi:hypothetical protein
MPFAHNRYTRAFDLLAKLRNERFGEERDGHRVHPVGPRWLSNDAEAFGLMSSALRGYYETREDTPEHCFVIGHSYGDAVVVPLRGHGTKKVALRYAIVLAVTAVARGRLQKKIVEIAGADVYQQATRHPCAKPRHDWLAWLNSDVEPETVYRGVYPQAKYDELAKLSVRPLEAADVPALAWNDQLARTLLREDGAVLYPKSGRPEIGSLNDAGGITWILLPALVVPDA